MNDTRLQLLWRYINYGSCSIEVAELVLYLNQTRRFIRHSLVTIEGAKKTWRQEVEVIGPSTKKSP